MALQMTDKKQKESIESCNVAVLFFKFFVPIAW